MIMPTYLHLAATCKFDCHLGNVFRSPRIKYYTALNMVSGMVELSGVDEMNSQGHQDVDKGKRTKFEIQKQKDAR